MVFSEQPQTEAQQTVDQIIMDAARRPTDYDVVSMKHRITMSKEYPPTEYLFATDGVPHLNTSEFHMITAAAKQGKTSFTNILCACAISNDRKWGTLTCLKPCAGRPVIIFDCEENESDTAKHNRQILRMAGCSDEEDHPDLIVYNLRQDMSYDERRRFVFETIRRFSPLLAIIDGLRDIILDINDGKENPILLSELMSLASETKSAIVGILHNNPNSDKARGWCGTEGMFRCGYTYNLEKKGNVVTVSATLTRNAPVPDMKFTFGYEGIPISDEFVIQQNYLEMEKQRQREAEKERQRKNDEHLDILMKVIRQHDGQLSRKELVEAIDAMNISGFKSSKVQQLIKEQLDKSDCPFIERNSKFYVSPNPVQSEISFGN